MNIAARKNKSKRLLLLIGDFIEVTLKTMTKMSTINEALSMTNTVSGYVIDVDESFLYLGHDMTGYSDLIELEEVGKISIVEDIPEELLAEIPGDDHVH
ncbi:MAG: hypothetical protein COB41_00580 [Proteobacteria bacterium]|nr:MAG: hypothetical protein COB41_00580 [Pseudomonadota bacterium]